MLLRFVRPQEPDQEAASLLFRAHRDGSVRLILLDLSLYELVNAEVRRMGERWDVVRDDLNDIFGLELHMVRIDVALATETAKVADETGLSGYDAAFVAAGAHVRAPLITTDRRILERAAGYDVIDLADLAS